MTCPRRPRSATTRRRIRPGAKENREVGRFPDSKANNHLGTLAGNDADVADGFV